MMSKGQVSTEFLVIMAIGLVIALVLVYLLGGFAGMGAGTMQTQSMQAWGTAAPLAVTGWSQSGTTLQLQVQNNALNQVILTKISMDGSVVSSTGTAFTSGQAQAINVTMPIACGATGTTFSHMNVTFTYTENSITNQTERGPQPLVGDCS